MRFNVNALFTQISLTQLFDGTDQCRTDGVEKLSLTVDSIAAHLRRRGATGGEDQLPPSPPDQGDR